VQYEWRRIKCTDHLGNKGVDGVIILKLTLKKQEVNPVMGRGEHSNKNLYATNNGKNID
jgi:hypothetical protein